MQCIIPTCHEISFAFSAFLVSARGNHSDDVFGASGEANELLCCHVFAKRFCGGQVSTVQCHDVP